MFLKHRRKLKRIAKSKRSRNHCDRIVGLTQQQTRPLHPQIVQVFPWCLMIDLFKHALR